MSELQHPPIALGLGPELSLAQEFAQEAYLLLADNGYPYTSQFDGTTIVTLATDRVDMEAEGTEKETALRLCNMPVLRIMDKPDFELEPSQDYHVITFEYGELDLDSVYEAGTAVDYEGIAAGYEWQPYVAVVINAEKPDEVDILNAMTGEPLSQLDLVTAYALLTQVSVEMRYERFENLIQDEVEEGPDEAPDANAPKHYDMFDSGDYMNVSQCDTCGTVNQPCAHNPFTLN